MPPPALRVRVIAEPRRERFVGEVEWRTATRGATRLRRDRVRGGLRVAVASNDDADSETGGGQLAASGRGGPRLIASDDGAGATDRLCVCVHGAGVYRL
jgi:hypothetical protein